MSIVRLASLLVATALLVSACNKPGATQPNASGPGVSPTTAAPSNPAAAEFTVARANFKKDCSSCHAENGTGGPVKLEDGTKLKVPSLREGHALHHKDEDFVKQITNGGEGMPKFGDKLSREEIIDMVRFIRKEFQNK